MIVCTLALASLAAARSQALRVAERSTVSVLVDTHDVRPLAPGFAGYNVALMSIPLAYTDAHLAAAARRLSPGWLRFPAGTRSEAFDWHSGRSHQSWVDDVSRSFSVADRPFFHDMLQSALVALDAKGGERVDDAAAFAQAVGAEGLIVCVNILSDTPASAGEFARYARAHHIRVLAWELGNEPYFNRGRFATGTMYAAAARPFADAINRADSGAVVAVAMSDAGFQDRAWDDALAAFAPRYWDAVVYHHYPTVSGTPVQMMAALDSVLADRTTSYVAREVRPRFGAMPVMITEAGPQDGPEPGMSGTLYGGVWSAEYALRVSALRQMSYFGVHQLVGSAGVGVMIRDSAEVARGGHPRRASFYTSAQGAAYAVAASVINSAHGVYATRVQGGGTVPRAGSGAMPAVYAQAYRRQMRDAVVVTNKGPRDETLTLIIDGRPTVSSMRVVTVTGPSPTATNSLGRVRVAATASTASHVVRIPAYSVVQIVW
jgi:hypothetical protein